MRRLVALLVIALVALVFRCWRIESVPSGLYVDEVHVARNALAWRLDDHADWLGTRPLVVKGWVETSNLYLAIASTLMAIGGDGVLGVRMISVVPSLACVLLLFLLAREVADRRVAMLAAFLLACSHWASRTGRTGWDEVLMTALHLGALTLLARAHRRESSLEAAGAGASIGVSLYTYIASRLALLHVLVWQTWEVFVASSRRVALRRLALLIVSVAIIAGPFFLRLAPEQVNVRTRQVSVFSRDDAASTIAKNAIAHLAMFHVRGGAYIRDALPRFPMLDPMTGLLLLAGIIPAWRIGGWQRRMLITWFAIVILGGVLSVSPEGPPYPYRVANLAPWACLVAAIGGVWLFDRVSSPRRIVLATSFLIAIVVMNAWVVFVGAPAYPGSARVYGVAPTQIGKWLAKNRGERRAIIHIRALDAPAIAPSYPYAAANWKNYYRIVDRAFAVQLAAGVYAQHPERSLEPLRSMGDVDVVPELPRVLPSDAIVIAPVGTPGTALRAEDGRVVAVVVER